MALMLLQLGVPVLCALSLSGGVSDIMVVILFPVICALSSLGGGGDGNVMVVLFPVIFALSSLGGGGDGLFLLMSQVMADNEIKSEAWVSKNEG